MKNLPLLALACMAALCSGQSTWSGSGQTSGGGTLRAEVIIGGGDNLYCGPGDVASFGASDGPAQLPASCIYTASQGTPSPGSTLTAVDSADFAAKLAAASCGDTIVLNAGTTYTGKFTLPNKSCDANHWIMIRTTAIADPSFPAEGTRATPCEINQTSVADYPSYNCANPGMRMPTLQTTQANTPVIDTAAGANHYRLIGLNIEKPAGSPAVINALVNLSNGADHIIMDRCLLHGQPYAGVAADELQRAVNINATTYFALIDSWGYNLYCMSACTDAQVVSGGVSAAPEGPHKIVNNLLASSGESFLWGGGGVGASTLTPHDLEIRRNHSFKPLSWMLPVGGSGTHPVPKNLGECKNCTRVLLEANIFENSWAGWQTDQMGYAFLLTPKSQNSHEDFRVAISGTAVAYFSGSGNRFSADMVGHRLVIKDAARSDNNHGYTIAGYVDADHVTLQTAPTGGDGQADIYACHPGLCPTCFVRHVSARFNHVRNTMNGAQIAAVPSSNCNDESAGLSNIIVRDNLFDGLDGAMSNGNDALGYARAIDINNSLDASTISDISIVHNTVAATRADRWTHSGLAQELDATSAAYLANMTYRDNIAPAAIHFADNQGGLIAGGAVAGLSKHDCPNHDGLNCTWTLAGNVLGISLWDTQLEGDPYPSSNQTCGTGGETCFPNEADPDPAKRFSATFVNYNGGYAGDYRLSATSPYNNAAADGRDIGADIDAIASKTAGVWSATTYAPLNLTTASLPNGTVGVTYSQTLAASSGASPFKQWALQSGVLPAGLSLSRAGVISGIPTATGTSSFSVRVEDGAKQSAVRSLSITIN